LIGGFSLNAAIPQKKRHQLIVLISKTTTPLTEFHFESEINLKSRDRLTIE
jgi:hypothetical protein